MIETLNKTIFGTNLKITFIGDDIDDKGYFHIINAKWDQSNYTPFQNKLFTEYITDNLNNFEHEINYPKKEI